MASSFAGAVAENGYDAVDQQLLRQVSLSCLAMTAEARTQCTRAQRASRVRESHRYRPLKGGGIRPGLRREKKEVASRFFQLASGHAAIGSYLRVLVVWQRQAAVAPPPLGQLPSLAPTKAELWKSVGKPVNGNTADTLRQAAFPGRACDPGGPDLPSGHKDGEWAGTTLRMHYPLSFAHIGEPHHDSMVVRGLLGMMSDGDRIGNQYCLLF